jgi:hypothetical protein
MQARSHTDRGGSLRGTAPQLFLLSLIGRAA